MPLLFSAHSFISEAKLVWISINFPNMFLSSYYSGVCVCFVSVCRIYIHAVKYLESFDSPASSCVEFFVRVVFDSHFHLVCVSFSLSLPFMPLCFLSTFAVASLVNAVVDSSAVYIISRSWEINGVDQGVTQRGYLCVLYSFVQYCRLLYTIYTTLS